MRSDPVHDNWGWRDGLVEPGRAVVFDLDGVLSDAASRQHYLEGPWRDWDSFFDKCGDDPLIEEVAQLLDLLDPGLVVVLLTARPAWVQPQTLAWLHRYKLRWDLLVMRDRGDYAAAREFKRRSIRELRQQGLEPVLSFEDDRRNVAMFHEEGVPTVYIHSGYYD
jgi:phosphoglycolate phosphatase-like HAD superfamily hydrolase